PAFDGDLRRHPGRYAVHSHSKDRYDERMGELVREYLADHPEPGVFDFLRHGYQQLWNRHGGITGVVVPRPKLLPVGWTTTRAAAQEREERGQPALSRGGATEPTEVLPLPRGSALLLLSLCRRSARFA